MYIANIDKSCPRLGRSLEKSNPELFKQWTNHLVRSKWFERGWKLQELLAPLPEKVQFFSAGGKHLGGLYDLALLISYTTNIDSNIFNPSPSVTESLRAGIYI
jgi:hypothetical protein